MPTRWPRTTRTTSPSSNARSRVGPDRGVLNGLPERSAARRRPVLEPAQGGRDVDASAEHRRQRVTELLEAGRRRLDREARGIELRGDLLPAERARHRRARQRARGERRDDGLAPAVLAE